MAILIVLACIVLFLVVVAIAYYDLGLPGIIAGAILHTAWWAIVACVVLGICVAIYFAIQI